MFSFKENYPHQSVSQHIIVLQQALRSFLEVGLTLTLGPFSESGYTLNYIARSKKARLSRADSSTRLCIQPGTYSRPKDCGLAGECLT